MNHVFPHDSDVEIVSFCNDILEAPNSMHQEIAQFVQTLPPILRNRFIERCASLIGAVVEAGIRLEIEERRHTNETG